jgi:ketosteroid isomerase-like protein
MKTPIAFLMLLGMAGLPAWSQAPPAPAPAVTAAAPDETAAHNELRAFRDGLLDAINKGDTERELTYFHPNTVITWHNAEVSRGRDGARAYLTRMLTGPDKVVESYKADVNVDELTILYGGDTGISFGSAVEHFKLANGKTLDLPARWSATLVKEDGKWLVASLHASENLFDNPILAMAKRMMYWAGGIGLLVGLAAGFLLGRRRKPA